MPDVTMVHPELPGASLTARNDRAVEHWKKVGWKPATKKEQAELEGQTAQNEES